MKDKRLEDQLARVAALEEPARRALYAYIASQPGEVSRDQAARALRISRSLAAFHLDKLVEAGLLETVFRRLSGRSGPGAGRPSKLYRRSAQTIELSLPERRYELAGQLMSQALSAEGSDGARAGLERAAREWGERVGAEARARKRSETSRDTWQARVMDVLRSAGFEPRADDRGGIVLRNCPFDALARGSRDLVCGMNFALIDGLLRGLEVEGVAARAEPQPGMCCVAIRPDDASA